MRSKSNQLEHEASLFHQQFQNIVSHLSYPIEWFLVVNSRWQRFRQNAIPCQTVKNRNRQFSG